MTTQRTSPGNAAPRAGAGSGHASAVAAAWPAGGPIRAGLFTLLLLVLGFGGWSIAAQISGAVIASGQIEVEQNRQVLQHLHGGVVQEILVTEGQQVTAGDPLILLDGAQLTGERSVIETQLFEVLARRGRLEAERDDSGAVAFPPALVAAAADQPAAAEQLEGQRRLFEARRTTLAQRIAQLDRRREQLATQIEGIEAQIVALETQLELIGQERATQQDLLDRGLSQAARVLALQREEARLQGSLGALVADRAQAEGSATDIDLEILTLQVERREQAEASLRDLAVQEQELTQRLATLDERIEGLALRAPVTGIVFGLRVTTPRSVLRPGDPALFLVPQDRPLVIVAQVQPNDIDQVYLGQEARLMFPAFGLRDAPELTGRVTMVSADSFEDQQTGRPYFRTEIMLDPASMEALDGFDLVPGMQVEAFISTEARTPLAYLTEPLAIYFSRALRES